MSLNWNEIKSRGLLFSKANPFWIAFFEIFGITDKRVATFELSVKKLGGSQGFVDLCWPGVLLVEHKSRGKNLDDAVDKAVGYLHNLYDPLTMPPAPAQDSPKTRRRSRCRLPTQRRQKVLRLRRRRRGLLV